MSNKDQRVGIRMTEDLKKKLEDQANSQNLKLSEYARKILEKEIKPVE